MTFLKKIKYLTYHIDPNEIEGLSKLVLLYSTAHDLFLKTHNFFEIEKAGLATAVFKLTATNQAIDAETFAHILFVITRFTINNISGYLRNSLYKFIYEKTPKNWYKNRKVSKSIMYSYGKMSITSDEFLFNIKKLCEEYEKEYINDPAIAVRSMICSLNLQLMTGK